MYPCAEIDGTNLDFLKKVFLHLTVQIYSHNLELDSVVQKKSKKGKEKGNFKKPKTRVQLTE